MPPETASPSSAGSGVLIATGPPTSRASLRFRNSAYAAPMATTTRTATTSLRIVATTLPATWNSLETRVS